MTNPRVFIIRHGETEWSLSGRHTGSTDIPLTPAGEKRVRATGKALVGPDRLIVPGNLAHVYVSPRRRAQRTLELLGLGCEGSEGEHRTRAKVQVDERVREWEYGDYEGVTSKEIQAGRRERGEAQWDIWRDGCPGGESPADVTARVDSLIHEIRERWHRDVIGKPKTKDRKPFDVLIVAHGHVLRALAGRWVGRDVRDNPSLILEAGGVGTLSYEHGRLEEPAILLGGAFMSDVVESAREEEKRVEGGEGK